MHTTFDTFKKALIENGFEFPDSCITSLLQITQSMKSSKKLPESSENDFISEPDAHRLASKIPGLAMPNRIQNKMSEIELEKSEKRERPRLGRDRRNEKGIETETETGKRTKTDRQEEAGPDMSSSRQSRSKERRTSLESRNRNRSTSRDRRHRSPARKRSATPLPDEFYNFIDENSNISIVRISNIHPSYVDWSRLARSLPLLDTIKLHARLSTGEAIELMAKFRMLKKFEFVLKDEYGHFRERLCYEWESKYDTAQKFVELKRKT
ncbi:ATP-dependent RNA helicase DHX8-like [Sitodiplosis mosellana]|uniref:ATP-dependent RNA helicase DHX8-like n=1 Tax=Sitodiplosis mosellana TaxID=263140 RepID=UPI002444F305|nr:ATP-dependent RNA helicase DHX8-like [Sitodiplosis mosellana]